MVFPRRAGSRGTASAFSLRRRRKIERRLVQDDALDRIELSLPWRPLEGAHRGPVTRLAAHGDAGWSEIDILGLVLVFETRRQEAHHMHLRHAAMAGEITHRLGFAYMVRQMANQLADDVAQPMSLLLPGDVACDPARILDVLLAMKNFPDRLRHLPFGIPQMNRED